MIVVTGATGHLGTHVVEQLIEAVPASTVRLAVRSPDKAAAFAARGVQVAAADYTDPESLRRAFEGADKLLLISSPAVGQRAAHHGNVVNAAREVGVPWIAYTSILHADTSHSALAEEHLQTEAMLRQSGIDHVLLRNGWYTENYAENLAMPLKTGKLYGAAGEGRVAPAPRADYAAAAVAVLTGSGHADPVYELAGDTAFTLADLAAAVTAETGQKVVYVDLPETDYEQALVNAGVPGPMAHALATSDTAIAHGDLDDRSGDLSRLIGRSTTPLRDTLRAGLAAVA